MALSVHTTYADPIEPSERDQKLQTLSALIGTEQQNVNDLIERVEEVATFIDYEDFYFGRPNCGTEEALKHIQMKLDGHATVFCFECNPQAASSGEKQFREQAPKAYALTEANIVRGCDELVQTHRGSALLVCNADLSEFMYIHLDRVVAILRTSNLIRVAQLPPLEEKGQ